MIKDFDIGIIGGGIAGYTAALHYSKSGKKVVLFEKSEIGGTCLNKGCIPTKSILKSSEIYRLVKNSEQFGVTCENVKFDYKKVIERKNEIIITLRKNIELALKSAKISVIKTEAKILSDKQIQNLQTNEIYETDRIVCCTGSGARKLPGFDFDGEFILNSDDVLELEKLPQNMLIVGSGAIGCEWAQIMNNFGVETTVIELAQNLLPLADIDISKRLERVFKSKGINFYKETSIEGIDGKNVHLSNGQMITPEKILVSIGRIPNVIEKLDGITYLGDVSGEIQLAHYAQRQSLFETIGLPYNKNLIPSVVYGTPEIAWVGKREQDLEKGCYTKANILISSLGKAWCDCKTDGIIKVLKVENKIVGAHIMAEHASSMINTLSVAIQKGVDIEDVCFPHPTYSEGMFDVLLKMYEPNFK